MLSVAQTFCLLYLLVCVGRVSGRVDATQCHANASLVDGSGTEPLCICLQGFKGNGLDCDDIDECATMKDVCQHGQCRNFAGGYWCECNKGYAPSEDNKQCQEVKCEDIYNKTVCKTRADNRRCKSHPDEMKQCKKSCNNCNGETPCEDENNSPMCLYWESVGECHNVKQAWMSTNCRKSCGLCTVSPSPVKQSEPSSWLSTPRLYYWIGGVSVAVVILIATLIVVVWKCRLHRSVYASPAQLQQCVDESHVYNELPSTPNQNGVGSPYNTVVYRVYAGETKLSRSQVDRGITGCSAETLEQEVGNSETEPKHYIDMGNVSLDGNEYISPQPRDEPRPRLL
ncbi:hypothetical protein ScPMuIL_009577 [Solemya velum]